jgi:hypothetical protein
MKQKQKQLPPRVKAIIQANNLSEDLIDKELSEEELLNHLKELGFTDKGITPKEQFNELFEGELKRRLELDMEELKKPSPTDVYYQELYEVLELFLKSPVFNLLIISGRAGIGKSYKIVEWASRKNIIAYKYNGHITNLRLYQILYENDDSLIVFDDSNPILEDTNSISLLLQACETMKTRVVSWNTSRNMDIPQRFGFDGKVIILTNKIFDEIDEALLSRAIKFNLNFDNVTIIKIINSLCQLPEKKMILDLLQENVFKMEINLRLYKLLENLLLFLKEKNQIGKFLKLGGMLIEMESNPALKYAYELLKRTNDLKKCMSEFMEETGMSKRTFYRYRDKIGRLFLCQAVSGQKAGYLNEEM